MTISNLSQNGQTTVPDKVREFLHVGPSDKLVYQFEGDRVFLEPASSSTEALYGSFKSKRTPPTKEELRAAKVASTERKLGR